MSRPLRPGTDQELDGRLRFALPSVRKSRLPASRRTRDFGLQDRADGGGSVTLNLELIYRVIPERSSALASTKIRSLRSVRSLLGSCQFYEYPPEMKPTKKCKRVAQQPNEGFELSDEDRFTPQDAMENT
jgi:hypothetical protein